MERLQEQRQRSQKAINLKNQSNRTPCIQEYADSIRAVAAEPEVAEVPEPEPQSEESPVPAVVEIPTTSDPVKDDAALQELQSQLAEKDTQISSLQEELSSLKSQEVLWPSLKRH